MRSANAGGALGLVPTMGALHRGHTELIKQARAANDCLLVTIFVNRAQFDDADDFLHYPRTEADDLALLSDAGVDYVFIPSEEEMYPVVPLPMVSVAPLSHAAEVQARPGHFDGVATIVTKLFVLTRPQRAYFGVKDFCQLTLVTMLSKSMLFDIEIVPVATVRDENGLALSSRNRLLSDEELQSATILYKSLIHVEKMWNRGVRKVHTIKQTITDILSEEPLAELDYVSVADKDTLAEAQQAATSDTVVSVAAHFGTVRLIDNIVLKF